jgi:hypothetical protein
LRKGPAMLRTRASEQRGNRGAIFDPAPDGAKGQPRCGTLNARMD